MTPLLGEDSSQVFANVDEYVICKYINTNYVTVYWLLIVAFWLYFIQGSRHGTPLSALEIYFWGWYDKSMLCFGFTVCSLIKLIRVCMPSTAVTTTMQSHWFLSCVKEKMLNSNYKYLCHWLNVTIILN